MSGVKREENLCSLLEESLVWRVQCGSDDLGEVKGTDTNVPVPILV